LIQVVTVVTDVATDGERDYGQDDGMGPDPQRYGQGAITMTTLDARIPAEASDLARELTSAEIELVSGGDIAGFIIDIAKATAEATARAAALVMVRQTMNDMHSQFARNAHA
jgi:hypothetical protein